LIPQAAADYAFVLYNVVAGGEAFNLGEGAAEDLGLEVVDDQTLVITVPAATGYLRSIFTMWQFSATPSWLIEEVGAEWIEDENFQSYGPFTLKEWNHDQSVILIKNPFYPGTDYMRAAQVDEVHMFNYGSAPSLAEFEAGNL
jgi:ABC-type oligopeptide transport system substrate-binding subunit